MKAKERVVINIDVDRPPRKPIEWVPWPAPKGTYEERVAAVRRQYPKLSESEAGLLLVYQATSEVSAVSQGSDGGGRFPRYMNKLRMEGKL